MATCKTAAATARRTPLLLLWLTAAAAVAALAGGAAAAAVPPVDGECAPDAVACADGSGCVAASARCNGVPDCADASDEAHCASDPAETSGEGAARKESAESMEAPQSAEVALEAAAGGAAAWNSSGCLPDEHRCLDGTCISRGRVCDGPRDCFDGSDEDALVGCANTNSSAAGEAGGDTDWIHPGAAAAAALSGVDHLPIAARNCSADEFRCSDGTCVALHLTCDDRADCPDGSDEMLACATRLRSCNDGFKCVSDGRCVPNEWVCDGVPECRDKSDEDPALCSHWRMPTTAAPEEARAHGTSSGDPCARMEPAQRQLCWEAQLQTLKIEEMQLRQKVAQEQLQSVQLDVVAAKDLHLEQLQTAELQRRAAADLLQQQQELHHIRLQALKRAMVGVAAATAEGEADELSSAPSE